MNRWRSSRSVARVVVAMLFVTTAVADAPGGAGAAPDSITLGDLAACPEPPGPVTPVDPSEDPFLSRVQRSRASVGLAHVEENVWAAIVSGRYAEHSGTITPAEESAIRRLSASGDVLFRVAEKIGIPFMSGFDWPNHRIDIAVETEAERAAYAGELARQVDAGALTQWLADRIDVEATGDGWADLEMAHTTLAGRVRNLPFVFNSLSGPSIVRPVITMAVRETVLADHELTDLSSFFDGVDSDHVCVLSRPDRPVEPPQPSGDHWTVVSELFRDPGYDFDKLIEVVATPTELAAVWRFGGDAPSFDPLTHFVALTTTGVSGSCPESNLVDIAPTPDGATFDFESYPQAFACTADWNPLTYVVLVDRELLGLGTHVLRDERGDVVTSVVIEPGSPVREVKPTPGPPSNDQIIPISDRTLAPTGGTWWVDRGGGVYAMGGAPYLGGMGGILLDEPVVSIVATPTGRGYWLFAADGGVFAFGDAPFLGSIPGVLPPGGSLVSPIVDADVTPTGQGYWLAAADGGVFAFGDADFYGSVPGSTATLVIATGFGAAPDGRGYAVVLDDGSHFGFGDVPEAPSFRLPARQRANDIIVGRSGLLIVDGFDATALGESADLSHPVDSMLGFCAPGLTRSTAHQGSTEHNIITPPGWAPRESMADELRNRPGLAGGVWLQVDNVFTDPIGERQVWMARSSDSTRRGWQVGGLTRCVD